MVLILVARPQKQNARRVYNVTASGAQIRRSGSKNMPNFMLLSQELKTEGRSSLNKRSHDFICIQVRRINDGLTLRNGGYAVNTDT